MNDSGVLLGFGHFIGQADDVIRFILLILLGMSVATWYVSLLRLARGLARRRRSQRFLGSFRHQTGPFNIDRCEPFSRVAASGLRAWERYGEAPGVAAGNPAGTAAELLTRALRRALIDETTRAESGLTLLASVASSAPFVGLFGTVWGIYHALLAIGAGGAAALAQVAGPVGEALIMTAIGLSVAIPAVLAYNAFQRSNRILLAELDGFAHDLYERLTCGVSRLTDFVQESR